jgi:hypothetical protein
MRCFMAAYSFKGIQAEKLDKYRQQTTIITVTIIALAALDRCDCE